MKLRAKVYEKGFFSEFLSFQSLLVFIKFVYDVFHVNGKAWRFRYFEKNRKEESKTVHFRMDIPEGHKVIQEGKARILYPSDEDGDVPVSREKTLAPCQIPQLLTTNHCFFAYKIENWNFYHPASFYHQKAWYFLFWAHPIIFINRNSRHLQKVSNVMYILGIL